MKQLYLTFLKYNTSGSGILNIREFDKMMKAGGIMVNLTTLQHVFRQVKNLKKSGICFEDLIDIITIENNSADTEDDYKRLFATYDRYKRGKFDFEDY